MKTSDLFKDRSAAASRVAGMYTVLCVTAPHAEDNQNDDISDMLIKVERGRVEKITQGNSRDLR